MQMARVPQEPDRIRQLPAPPSPRSVAGPPESRRRIQKLQKEFPAVVGPAAFDAVGADPVRQESLPEKLKIRTS